MFFMGKTADLIDRCPKDSLQLVQKESKSQKVFVEEASYLQSSVSKYFSGKLGGRKKCDRKRCTSLLKLPL